MPTLLGDWRGRGAGCQAADQPLEIAIQEPARWVEQLRRFAKGDAQSLKVNPYVIVEPQPEAAFSVAFKPAGKPFADQQVALIWKQAAGPVF